MRVNFSSGRKLGGTFLADLVIQAPEYVKGWGENVGALCEGKNYWKLHTVLSYLGVIYLLYMLRY